MVEAEECVYCETDDEVRHFTRGYQHAKCWPSFCMRMMTGDAFRTPDAKKRIAELIIPSSVARRPPPRERRAKLLSLAPS